nr:hypothetical protein [Corynebacterium lactis]
MNLISVGSLLTSAALATSNFSYAASHVPSNEVVDEVIIYVDEDGNTALENGNDGNEGKNLLTRAGERAPDCISARSEWGFVQVYNDCPFDLRVKIIFAFAPDSGCKLVKAGTRTNIAPSRGRIDGIETC